MKDAPIPDPLAQATAAVDIAIRLGATYEQRRAWIRTRRIAPEWRARINAELGRQRRATIPEGVMADLPDGVSMHGSSPAPPVGRPRKSA